MSNEKRGAVAILTALFLVVAISGCTTNAPGGSTDASLSNVKASGKLVVGSDIPYEPMEFYDEKGQVVGLDVDIIREIAASMGVEIQFVDYAWDELFKAVENGDIDIAIASITITPERSERMLFSSPYFNAGQTIVVKNSNNEIKTPEDLKGRKVGAQKETTSIDEAEKYGATAMPYDGFDVPEGNPQSGILYDLKSGTIDAMVADYVLATDLVKRDQSLKIAGEPFTQEFYGMATKLGNNALMDEINRILREMKRDGKLDEIKNKWLE